MPANAHIVELATVVQILMILKKKNKGIACWMYLKCQNIYGIHMHVYPYIRQYIEHLSIYLL